MMRSSRGLVQLSAVQNVPVPILQRRFKGHSYWRWWWWLEERRSFHEFLLLNRCYNFSQSMGPNIVSHCNWKSFWRRLNRCQILIHCTDLCPLEYLCKLPRTFSNTATENHTELHISFFLFWRFKYIKIFTFFEIRSFELCKNVFFEQKNHHILKGKIQKTCWITFAVSGFIQDAIVIPAHWILAKNDGISSLSFLFCPFFQCLSKVPRNCQSSLKITGLHNKMKFDFPFLWIELHAGCHKKNTFRMMLEPWNTLNH